MSENNKNHEHLDWLLEYTTPTELRKSIQAMQFAYLIEQENSGLDDRFKQVVNDCRMLIDFFERLESNG